MSLDGAGQGRRGGVLPRRSRASSPRRTGGRRRRAAAGLDDPSRRDPVSRGDADNCRARERCSRTGRSVSRRRHGALSVGTRRSDLSTGHRSFDAWMERSVRGASSTRKSFAAPRQLSASPRETRLRCDDASVPSSDPRSSFARTSSAGDVARWTIASRLSGPGGRRRRGASARSGRAPRRASAG